MQINLSFFEDCLSKRDKKDLYSRPLTALLGNRFHTGSSQEGSSLSFLTRRRDSQCYNNYRPKNEKKSYRNIRSATLYEALRPQVNIDKPIKLQIFNNACLKKVYQGKNNSHHKTSFIFDVNQTLSHNIEHDYSKKQNQKPKFQSKRLKALRVSKPTKVNQGQIQSDLNLKPQFVRVVGTKIL